MRGIGILKRKERALAKQRAAASADLEVDRLRAEAGTAQQRAQTELDDEWERLCKNDPDTVLAVLADAFGDNDAPAAAVGVEGAEVSLVVLVPGVDFLPEKMPSVTAAGSLSLKKITKADRSAYYRVLVCGHLLATIRETFAVAPATRGVRAVVIRASGMNAYGTPKVECIMAAEFTREALEGVRWGDVDAPQIVTDVATNVMVNLKGAAKEIQPLDLAKEEALASVLSSFDTSELVSAG